jgi:alkaline phosphatase
MRMKIGAVAIAVLALAVLPAARAPFTSPGDQRVLSNNHVVKHVILMVADGMGLADVTAARIKKNGISGPSLRFETLEEIGYQRTYSERNTVTDSAAAASAWACGEKFVNDEICAHGDGRPNNANLLELAKAEGWATGLVTTQTVTNATPAAFGAHVTFRDCENEIARQYVEVTRPDVILGGGRNTFKRTTPDACGGVGDYIAAAQLAGYTYVLDKAALQTAVAGGASKLLGLFRSSYMTPEIWRDIVPGAANEPHLSEMAAAAINTLDQLDDRFFVMIEGGLIDLANHAEWLDAQAKEVSAFDDAVGVVLDWIDASEERMQHTLLIVLADHETGGFAVMGSEVAGAEPLGTFTGGWAFVMPPPPPPTLVAGHTGTDILIWSQGPGSAALGRAIDNTTIYEVVKAVLR